MFPIFRESNNYIGDSAASTDSVLSIFRESNNYIGDSAASTDSVLPIFRESNNYIGDSAASTDSVLPIFRESNNYIGDSAASTDSVLPIFRESNNYIGDSAASTDSVLPIFRESNNYLGDSQLQQTRCSPFSVNPIIILVTHSFNRLGAPHFPLINNEVIGRQDCDFTTAHMTGLVVAVWLSARPETCKNAAEPVRFSPADK
ncbi:hypothetical protein RRG08_063435 [Elysia crispata]|uniref:Uncharacterized protein n=1 Tax=Elysia crispata TaxID=231223 RepID=A0AAE1A9J0_9GAST|nr:hypothetical protein RRG08_063435 [Elysia crispata]